MALPRSNGGVDDRPEGIQREKVVGAYAVHLRHQGECDGHTSRGCTIDIMDGGHLGLSIFGRSRGSLKRSLGGGHRLSSRHELIV